MKSTLIQHATIINEGVAQVADLRIRGAYIEAIASVLTPLENEDCIDATGCYLLPGLIDDQVHFREPGLTHKACIESESQAAIAGGITSFIEMPNTQPQTTTLEAYQDKLDRAQKTSAANYSFMFGGTNDNLEVLKQLDKNKVAGIKLFLGSSTGNMLVDNPEVLREIFSSTDLVIAAHCEDEQTIRENLQAHIDTYGEEIPIEKHPVIRSEAACYISSSQAIALAKETGARLHVFHVSTAKETALFQNDIPLKDKKITAEVCTHHLWFSDEDYAEKGTLIKWNPAVKNDSDREALWEALNDDRLDILATDHAPHTLAEKQQPYLKAPSGGPLVQHALPALLTAVNKGKITLQKVVEKACHNPAILFDIEKRGFLRTGYFADLVLVDLHQPFEVNKADLLYQCQWSPFEGTLFTGVVKTTFVNGHKVYDQGQILEKNAGRQLTFTR
ncbi:MAG: dihydroorotase [Flavobacteriaceae bacterium]